LGTPDAYLCAIAKLQESGVLSFDNIDILPTDNDGAYGIVNANTLIENLNAGTMQNDVDDQSKECAPCYDTQCSAQAITEDALQGHSSEQRVGNACTHQRAAGSKKFTITHRSILSRKAEVLDV
jgi:surface antigen